MLLRRSVPVWVRRHSFPPMLHFSFALDHLFFSAGRVENKNENFRLPGTVFEILSRFWCKQKWKWLPKIRKQKWYFYLKLKAKTISASIDRFQKLPYLSGNLPPVLLYLKPNTSTSLNGMLVYVYVSIWIWLMIMYDYVAYVVCNFVPYYHACYYVSVITDWFDICINILIESSLLAYEMCQVI